jgi:predicted enzyme related to lactoylglutathione lyase
VLRFETLTIDCDDHLAVARFWEAALGWEIAETDDEGTVLRPPSGVEATELLFLRVPDRKAGKNRLHLDLRPDDQAAEVARLEALGAHRVDIGQGPDVTWVVLADPEGNEFCVLRSAT